MNRVSLNKTIRRGTREVIFNVFIRCLAEYQAGKLLNELNDVYQRTADMTGKSASTIRKIAEEGERNNGVFITPGKKRKGRPRKDSDCYDLCAIRQKVLFFYTVKKQIPSVRNLLSVVREELGYNGSRESLRHQLLALGFAFKKCKNNKSALVEKPHIAALRERYLKEIIASRNVPQEHQKNIIYLDECYVHASYKLMKCWQAAGIGGVKHNISYSKRHMIMVAGSEKGFLPKAMLITSGTNKKEDYHSEMNHYNFTKWVKENVIPNISEPSIIVMDNAPYHSVVTNKAPTTATKTDDINLWLLQNNIDFDPTWSKPELLMLVKQHKPKPIYEIDQIFTEHGHTVFRLPPFHCDLNPIEIIWAIVKKKLDSKSTDIRQSAEQALKKITIQDWENSSQQVVNIENEYFERGRTLYDEIDKIVNLREDSSSSSSSSDDDFFMTDDEDDETVP